MEWIGPTQVILHSIDAPLELRLRLHQRQVLVLLLTGRSVFFVIGGIVGLGIVDKLAFPYATGWRGL